MGSAASFSVSTDSGERFQQRQHRREEPQYNFVELMSNHFNGARTFERMKCDSESPIKVSWSHQVGQVFKYKSGLIISNDPTQDIPPPTPAPP